MAVKANSLSRLENIAKSKKPVENDILDGIDIFQSIPEQTDIETIRPSTLHKMIRRAQDMRIDSLDDWEASRLFEDTVALTVNEKNFVYVHEMDIKSGILRKSASETFKRIDELLAEDAEITQPVDETVTSQHLADLIETTNEMVKQRAKELNG